MSYDEGSKVSKSIGVHVWAQATGNMLLIQGWYRVRYKATMEQGTRVQPVRCRVLEVNDLIWI